MRGRAAIVHLYTRGVGMMKLSGEWKDKQHEQHIYFQTACHPSDWICGYRARMR